MGSSKRSDTKKRSKNADSVRILIGEPLEIKTLLTRSQSTTEGSGNPPSYDQAIEEYGLRRITEQPVSQEQPVARQQQSEQLQLPEGTCDTKCVACEVAAAVAESAWCLACLSVEGSLALFHCCGLNCSVFDTPCGQSACGGRVVIGDDRHRNECVNCCLS